MAMGIAGNFHENRSVFFRFEPSPFLRLNKSSTLKLAFMEMSLVSGLTVSKFSNRLLGLHTIPNGVDTEMYSPKNRQLAREAIASIVGKNSILDAPLVGILNGFQPQTSKKKRGTRTV